MTHVEGKGARTETAVRLRHRPVKSNLPQDICWTCQTYWPCDVDDLRAQLKEAREKLANWEPWMSALGRMLVVHKIARFPDDVLAWREKLAAVEPLLRRLRTAHRDRHGMCETCCVPWPCMDAVAVDRILKGGD